MNSWKTRLISLAVLLFILLILDIRVRHYSTIVYEGALKVLVCIGRVEKVDSSESVSQIVSLRLLSGHFRGRLVTAENIFTGRPYGDRILRRGDKLFVEIPLKQPRIEDSKIEKVYLGKISAIVFCCICWARSARCLS